MRVLLVQPNESEGELIPVKLRPLALELLAAHLEPEHDVRIIDLRLEEGGFSRMLEEFEPEVVGLTCTFTSGVRVAQRATRVVRQTLPEAKVVLGGVHASLQPGDFAFPLSDYVVRGTGERTFVELVGCLEEGKEPHGVPGVFLCDGAGQHYTFDRDPRTYRWSRDYRLPARRLTARYADRYAPAPNGEPLVLMVSSRGCPFRCTFCAAWKLQGGKLDTRDPQCLLNELKSVEESFVYFFDDNTFANRKAMRRTAELLKVEGVEKHYQMWTSTDVICKDPELLAQWRDLGLVRLFTGFESVKDEQLAEMNKKARLRENDRAIDICRELGIELSPTFIVTPDFDSQDFEELKNYVDKWALRLPWFFILTPLPGTQLYADKASEIIEGDPSRYDLMHLTLEPQKLSRQAFMEHFVDLYRENRSWQQASSEIPVYRQLLDNVQTVLGETEPVVPVTGLDPEAGAFPAARAAS